VGRDGTVMPYELDRRVVHASLPFCAQRGRRRGAAHPFGMTCSDFYAGQPMTSVPVCLRKTDTGRPSGSGMGVPAGYQAKALAEMSPVPERCWCQPRMPLIILMVTASAAGP
jgi:hypothetical protein